MPILLTTVRAHADIVCTADTRVAVVFAAVPSSRVWVMDTPFVQSRQDAPPTKELSSYGGGDGVARRWLCRGPAGHSKVGQSEVDGCFVLGLDRGECAANVGRVSDMD